MSDFVSSTDTYLSFVLSLKDVSPLTVLSAFFLCLARVLPIMILAPFFGAKLLPSAIRVMFGVAFVAILLPQVLLTIHGDIAFDLSFFGYLLKELFIGFVLGFLVSVPFYIAQSSGSLIDHIRGSSALQVTDPSTKTQTGPVGILYNYVLIAIFFAIGGPFYFIDGLQHSFTLIPVNEVFNPLFFSMKLPFWKTILGLVNYILAMSIQLGAPALIGILMAEMFLGIANRLAPQVQIVFLGISLKSWVGLALLAAAWYFILQQMGKESLHWISIMQKTMVQTAGHY
jgi:type III secretion protein SpaR/YscT/HrcT